jgi:23S rRNA pseudouridine1911/1915/1917 synthase
MLNVTSRSQIERWIKNKKVALNGSVILRKNHKICPGDTVVIDTFQSQEKVILPEPPLEKLFEDEHLLIIDKPAGITVHPGAGERNQTILDRLLFEYPQLKAIPDTDRPGIVHRLDKGTSGVLVLAKSLQCQKRLQKAFRNRQIKKIYQALVKGSVRLRIGTLDKPLMRNPRHRIKFMVDEQGINPQAREALTHYRVLFSSSRYSWLKLFPETGRTHQIRVHLAAAGHPVLGDHLYGDRRSFSRLALHAYSLTFQHPLTGHIITSTAPLPPLFRQFVCLNILNPNRHMS